MKRFFLLFALSTLFFHAYAGITTYTFTSVKWASKVGSEHYEYERSVGDFVSGTLNIVKDESVFVYKVMGKTSQGENISFQIRVLATDWGNDER